MQDDKIGNHMHNDRLCGTMIGLPDLVSEATEWDDCILSYMFPANCVDAFQCIAFIFPQGVD